MASKHWPTYVLLSIYLLAMIIVTVIANRQNKRSMQLTPSNPNASMISTHFLAAKAFGPIILLFTTFATIFSGYTVVGVPNEAGINGFTAIRWVGIGLMVAVSILLVFPRIRRLSVECNYESPGDFINHRYDSKIVCCLVTLCLCVPQLLYLAVNIYSLGALLEFLTDGELTFYWVTIVCTLLILLFEALGGMRSVAYTDAVQSAVMVIVFISLPIVIGIKYGGFIGMVTNTEDLPCANSNNEQTSGCLNYAEGPVGTPIADEFYLRTPSALTTINYLLFAVSMLSFSLNPHLLQRAFTAKQDWQVRFVIFCLFGASFLAMIPGVLSGITSISNRNDWKLEYQYYPAFMAILGVFRDQGGFVAFLSYIALLAGISGIMSTADSALIGVSNTMSCDIFKNWLTPNLEQREIVWIGKIISVITMGASIGIAIHLYESGIDYGSILTLQQALLWQAFPAYIFGLYTKISTKSIFLGLVLGLCCDIILITLVFSDEGKNDPLTAIDPMLSALDKAWSSLVGVLVNLIGCGMGHCCFRWREEEVETEKLTKDKIEKIMENVQEPATKYYGVFLWFSGLCVFISAFHWIGEIDPKLEAKYGKDMVRSLLYNGYVTNVIAGLPQWTFATVMWYVVGCVCGGIATLLWKVNETVIDPVKSTSNAAIDMEMETVCLSPRSAEDDGQTITKPAIVPDDEPDSTDED